MPPAAHGFSLRREPLSAAIRVKVWVDSTSIFSGYGEIRSMYERLESIVLALRRWRALSSNTSLVNKRVTSMMMEGSRPVSLYSLISGRAVLPAASLAVAGFAAPRGRWATWPVQPDTRGWPRRCFPDRATNRPAGDGVLRRWAEYS